MKKILGLIIILILMMMNICSAEMKIKMLDVGQGESFLIQTDSENILIDTGDVGGREILFNELKKISGLNKIFLSHPHADHIANTDAILKNFPVEKVYDNGEVVASKYYLNYLATCAEKKIPVQALSDGDKIILDADTYIEVYNPKNFLDVNNNSLVFKVVHKKFSMLFTGDIGFVGEAEILSRGKNIKSTVLKAAHHGSKTSSSYNFVQQVNPKIVLISAGKNNRYGHPSADALKVFSLFTKKIFCTAQNGSVEIFTDGEGYTVTEEIPDNWLEKIPLPETVTTVTKL